MCTYKTRGAIKKPQSEYNILKSTAYNNLKYVQIQQNSLTLQPKCSGVHL